MKPEPSDDDLRKPRTVDKTEPGAHREAAESAPVAVHPSTLRDATDPAPMAIDRTDPSSAEDPGYPPEPMDDGASIPLVPSSSGVGPQASSPPLQPEVMDRLIRAFDRPPQRPQPNYVERPQSDGGNAVAYSSTADPAIAKYPNVHRAQVLVEIAELTRRLPAPQMEVPNTPSGGRDRTTAPPLRVQVRRRMRNRILAAVAALLVGGVAGAAATLRQTAPADTARPKAVSVAVRDLIAPAALPPASAPARSSEEPTPAGSATAPSIPAVTSAAPSAFTPAVTSSARAPVTRSPGLRSPPSSKTRQPATAPSTKPSDDTTLDELDRVRVAPAPGRD